MSLTEAADIVAHHTDKVRALLPALRSQSARLMRDAGNLSFFGTPCVLLEEGGRCSVYEHRPLVCRAHFVASPAERCSDGAGTVVKYDTRAVLQPALAAAMDSGKQPHSLVPIPMALLLAVASGDAG